MKRSWLGALCALLLLGCVAGSQPTLAQGTTTINNLPAASTPLSGTENVPIMQNGKTVRATTQQIGNLGGGGGGTPGGANGQLQINNNGAFGGGNLSGDVSTSGGTAATLATVNVAPGTFGDSTHCIQGLTVNGKGLVTAATQSASCPGSGGGAVSVTSASPNIVISPTPGTGTFTVGATYPLSVQTASTTIVTSQLGGMVEANSASALTFTIPSVVTTGFGSGASFDAMEVHSGGTLGFSSASTFLPGAPTLAYGQTATFTSDGATNWDVSAVSLPFASADTVVGNFSGSSAYPTAGALVNCTTGLTYSTTSHSFGCGAGSSGVTFTDGTHTVTGATQLTVTGGTVGGTSPNATLSVTGGGGSTVGPVYIANRWYPTQNTVTTSGTAIGGGTGAGAAIIRWQPWDVQTPNTLAALGGSIGTSSAGGNCQIALYASSGSTGLPTGSALVSTASISTASAVPVSGTASYSIASAGREWVGIMCDNSTVKWVAQASSTVQGYLAGASAQASLSTAGSGTSTVTTYSTTGVTYGTWPTNPTVTDTASTAGYFLPQFEVASVP